MSRAYITYEISINLFA